MNTTLLLGFARQRLTSPIRMVLLAFIVGVPWLVALAVPGTGVAAFRDISGIVMVFAAGAIGQDVSSGVLHLLLARPVSRPAYVAHRWFAAGLLAAAVSLLRLAIGFAICAGRGMPIEPMTALGLAGEHVLQSFGMAAVIVMLSSLVSGLADLGIYFLSVITSFVVQQLGAGLGKAWLERTGLEAQTFLSATVPLMSLVQGEHVALLPWIAYASTVALCLSIAIVAMNRKELTYASG